MTQSAKAEKKAQKEVAPEEPPQEDTVGKTGAKVVVAIERKGHGGKTVTRVEGLDPGRIDDIGLDLKRSLGCGATVTDGVVFLQGDQRNRAADWLKQKGAKRVVVSA
ncbi:MAG: translation initiation factor [Deltaproteobacteria bacterium]|nr:translation initiation factor [Deltaproteobacteria bacterium]